MDKSKVVLNFMPSRDSMIRTSSFRRLLSSKFLRQFIWRVGRSLYLVARRDDTNDMRFNGERELQAWIVTRLPQDETVIVFDIGANIGEWSSSFIKIAKLSNRKFQLRAFEPVPTTFRKLEGNIKLLNDKNEIGLYPMAMSSSPSTLTMHLLDDLAGTNSIYPHIGGGQGRTVEVTSTSIDAFCLDNNIAKINLLKCDAEGHDPEVIKGASGMLSKGQISVIQFEYNHKWIQSRYYLKDIFDLFQGLPYKIGKLCGGRVEIFQAWHPELERFFEGNYLAVHEEAMILLNCHEGSFDRYNTYSNR